MKGISLVLQEFGDLTKVLDKLNIWPDYGTSWKVRDDTMPSIVPGAKQTPIRSLRWNMEMAPLCYGVPLCSRDRETGQNWLKDECNPIQRGPWGNFCSRIPKTWDWGYSSSFSMRKTQSIQPKKRLEWLKNSFEHLEWSFPWPSGPRTGHGIWVWGWPSVSSSFAVQLSGKSPKWGCNAETSLHNCERWK